MDLLIGQAILTNDLERETSCWPPRRFASMCNSLIWAAVGQKCSAMPSFTERVNSPDGGIDAEWSIDIKDPLAPTPLIGPGWNVFQYKQRDMATGRRKIISGLKSNLKGAINEIIGKHNRTPDRYILLVNIDLKSNEKSEIRRAILEGIDDNNSIKVEITAAGELAALLNQYPHLRAAYFLPNQFETWQSAYESHKKYKPFGAGVELIGREAELAKLKSLIEDTHVRAILLTGAHDSGKTRLLLEALQDRQHDVAVALDPLAIKSIPSESLCNPQRDLLLVVEDPPADGADFLVHKALSSDHIKLLLTVESMAGVSSPAYSQDNRIARLSVDPLSFADSHKLLQAAGRSVDISLAEWLLREAGGFPGILLAAASFGNELSNLSQSGDSFAQKVGAQFAHRLEKTLGEEGLESARLLSVLTHVGVSGSYAEEFHTICELLGNGMTPDQTHLQLRKLEDAGYIQRGGSFATVMLPLLAGYLASQLLHMQPVKIFALFGRLDERGRDRFIQRLSQLPDAGVFWQELFSDKSPLSEIHQALDHGRLLVHAAASQPELTLQMLESAPPAERAKIVGEKQDLLLRVLEQLIFRQKTCRRALHLLWRLAEGETAISNGNASQLLAECFYKNHLKIPLSLPELLDLLQEFTSEQASKEGKLAAVRAMATSLGGRTNKDVETYARGITEIIFSMGTKDDEAGIVARAQLPELIAQYGMQVSPSGALDKFHTLIDWAVGGKEGLEISGLYNSISSFGSRLQCALDRATLATELEWQNQLDRYIRRVEELKKRIDKGPFAVQLKRWAGGWGYDGEGPRWKRRDAELINLAEQAVSQPTLLSNELLKWLQTLSAENAGSFFHFLGVADKQGKFRQIIEDQGREPHGIEAFARYWLGWYSWDRNAAEQGLDELASVKAPLGPAILQATAWIGVTQSGVARIETLADKGLISPEDVDRTVIFSRDMDADSLERLLKVILRDSNEWAGAAIDLLAEWSGEERPIPAGLAELGWHCLESDPKITRTETAESIDLLAARLTQENPERGLRFLQKILQRPAFEHRRWNPLQFYGPNRFRDTLLNSENRARLVEWFLHSAETRRLIYARLSDLIDQGKDRELLLELARRNVETARIVAAAITSTRPGFWLLAFALIKLHPADERLQSNLASGIMSMDSAIMGPLSGYYESRKREVERVLDDPATPAHARPWLREVISNLEGEVTSRVVWEYDLNVDGLMSYIEDKSSTQRLWAIARVLKYAKWEDVRKLLTLEDIVEALPHVNLPEPKRKILEKAIEVWRHGV